MFLCSVESTLAYIETFITFSHKIDLKSLRELLFEPKSRSSYSFHYLEFEMFVFVNFYDLFQFQMGQFYKTFTAVTNFVL
jgi:hypothetical protein